MSAMCSMGGRFAMAGIRLADRIREPRKLGRFPTVPARVRWVPPKDGNWWQAGSLIESKASVRAFASEVSLRKWHHMIRGRRFLGAAALASAGLAASFGLAACCALPIILTGIGVATAWLAWPSSVADPLRVYLTPLAAIALIGAAFLILRNPANCAPNDLCAKPLARLLLGGFVLVGAVLLYLSTQYA